MTVFDAVLCETNRQLGFQAKVRLTESTFEHHSMHQSQHENPFTRSSDEQVKPPMGFLKWMLVIGGVSLAICCGGATIGLMVVGVMSPETYVYKRGQVPKRFLETAREVGALHAGESVDFFYSDALLDVREGFYFVNDKKVVIYSNDGREPPLTILTFDEIASAELTRNESFIEDSEIWIETKDGEFHYLPVSSERKGDISFHRAIEKHLPESASSASE